MSVRNHASFVRAGIAGLVIATVLGCSREKPADTVTPTLEEFTKRVEEYVTLHKRLADSVGPLDETKSQAEIAARATILANAIVAARPGAKQGDIFTIETATIIATLIKEEYRRRPSPVIETRGDTQEELPDFVPKVNELYPTSYPLATFPPTLLPLLPKLPEEVEYRIVNHYLMLRDIESNLIIDFMPNAVPAEKS